MKIKTLLVALLGSIALTAPTYGDTIVTAPIDSRPVSCEYLNELAEINNDEVVYPQKDIMDMFSGNGSVARLADSQAVRDSIYELSKDNCDEWDSLIINTSTYFTGGLVGSRIGDNYKDIEKGLKDLKVLRQTYPKPYCYVNLTTPRALPETRLNSIWRDNNPIYGIGYYYLKHNKDCKDYEYIKSNYEKVNPSQLLMEYSYVWGKMAEGVPLSPWEKEFYKTVNARYMGKDPYKTFFNSYTEPFLKEVELFQGLMDLKEQGLIDEIVISTDDLQLPNSIVYFAKENKGNWVQHMGGSPVKYSLARCFFETGTTSLMKTIDKAEGKNERYRAMNGRGKDINVIYGTDEVPQLIYARDLTRKAGKNAKINFIYNSTNASVATFDVKNVNNIANNAYAFTGRNRSYSEGETDLYIYSYNGAGEYKTTLNQIRSSLLRGKNVGLIELYDSKTLNNSDNKLFKALIKGNVASIADLCTYSAWNTNGNAIGLGIAHVQVYNIAKENTKKPGSFVRAQTENMVRRALEDGVYTVQTKRLLSNAGYKPTLEETENSPRLRQEMTREDIFNAFKGKEIRVKGRKYKVQAVTLEDCAFPWARTFDCRLKVGCELK